MSRQRLGSTPQPSVCGMRLSVYMKELLCTSAAHRSGAAVPCSKRPPPSSWVSQISLSCYRYCYNLDVHLRQCKAPHKPLSWTAAGQMVT